MSGGEPACPVTRVCMYMYMYVPPYNNKSEKLLVCRMVLPAVHMILYVQYSHMMQFVSDIRRSATIHTYQ